MPMPDLSPAARALAQEYVRLKGEIAQPVVDDVMECLKVVCRQHFELRALGSDRIEKEAMAMAYGLIHEVGGRRHSGAVIPFPRRG